jgi:hypothetical protein
MQLAGCKLEVIGIVHCLQFLTVRPWGAVDILHMEQSGASQLSAVHSLQLDDGESWKKAVVNPIAF